MFLNKKRELIERELNLFKKEKEQQIIEKVSIQRIQLQNEIINLKIKSAEQRGNAEHEYHYAEGQKKAELARLDEEIKYKIELAESYSYALKQEEIKNEKIISNYEFLVKTLKEENQKLLEKLSSIDVKEIVSQVITK